MIDLITGDVAPLHGRPWFRRPQLKYLLLRFFMYLDKSFKAYRFHCPSVKTFNQPAIAMLRLLKNLAQISLAQEPYLLNLKIASINLDQKLGATHLQVGDNTTIIHLGLRNLARPCNGTTSPTSTDFTD